MAFTCVFPYFKRVNLTVVDVTSFTRYSICLSPFNAKPVNTTNAETSFSKSGELVVSYVILYSISVEDEEVENVVNSG